MSRKTRAQIRNEQRQEALANRKAMRESRPERMRNLRKIRVEQYN